jgi:hypothetical protein
MLDAPLHVLDGVARLALVPAPVEIFGDGAELNYQIVRQVFGFNLAAFLSPQPNQHGFVGTHDGPGIGAADKGTAIVRIEFEQMEWGCGASLYITHGDLLWPKRRSPPQCLGPA